MRIIQLAERDRHRCKLPLWMARRRLGIGPGTLIECEECKRQWLFKRSGDADGYWWCVAHPTLEAEMNAASQHVYMLSFAIAESAGVKNPEARVRRVMTEFAQLPLSTANSVKLIEALRAPDKAKHA